ncbi:MAG: ribonuclease PH [Bdellovibrio sp. SCN 50-8]|nr:MAG: ribonuclease PH [Bdellovibrio sp. SCN 50-8]
MRIDKRDYNQLRPVKITPHILDYAEGSVMVEFGKTRVLCSASYEDSAPKWLQGSGTGWVTAEYGMLPRSTQSRIKRDKTQNSGRTQEISRLIGRSLRAAVDLRKLGERQITIDCDVIQADGGTRTAAITGGFVALAFALKKLVDVSELRELPLSNYVSAVSVGLQNGKSFLDLNYDEDSTIHTDMNFVMTQDGRFIEIQGTAEKNPFSRDEMNQMMDYATTGCRDLFLTQEELIKSFFPLPKRF